MAKKGYESITWLAGNVFLNRGFAEKIERCGLGAVMGDCPYNDLTEAQRLTFEAAASQPLLRTIAKAWWQAYDGLRNIGAIPPAVSDDKTSGDVSTLDFWHP